MHSEWGLGRARGSGGQGHWQQCAAHPSEEQRCSQRGSQSCLARKFHAQVTSRPGSSIACTPIAAAPAGCANSHRSCAVGGGLLPAHTCPALYSLHGALCARPVAAQVLPPAQPESWALCQAGQLQFSPETRGLRLTLDGPSVHDYVLLCSSPNSRLSLTASDHGSPHAVPPPCCSTPSSRAPCMQLACTVGVGSY